jgi:hypothetical protein
MVIYSNVVQKNATKLLSSIRGIVVSKTPASGKRIIIVGWAYHINILQASILARAYISFNKGTSQFTLLDDTISATGVYSNSMSGISHELAVDETMTINTDAPKSIGTIHIYYEEI